MLTQTTPFEKSPDMSPLKPMVNNSTLYNRDLLNRSYSNINKQINKDRSYSPMNRSYMNTSQINFGEFFEKRRHNLEINLGDDDNYSFPLLMRRSQIYKGKEVFTVESFRSLKDLHSRINEWFRKNPELDCEDLYLSREAELVEQLGGVAAKHGHLLVFMHKRTYTRIDVKIYDGIVRLATLDDYKALREVLDVMFDVSKGIFGAGCARKQVTGVTSYNIDQLIGSTNIKTQNLGNTDFRTDSWSNNLGGIKTSEVLLSNPIESTIVQSTMISGVNPNPMVQSTTGRPTPLVMPDVVDINQQKLKWKELVDYWRVDEEAYPCIEMGLSGNSFLPDFSKGPAGDEKRKIQTLEALMNGDFKRVQEDMMASEITLLKRNKELLDLNKAMIAKCNNADELEKSRHADTNNNKWQIDYNISQSDLKKSKFDADMYKSQIDTLREENSTLRLKMITSEIDVIKTTPYNTTTTTFTDISSGFMMNNLNRSMFKLNEDSNNLKKATVEFKEMVVESIRIQYHDLADNDPKKITKGGFIKRSEEIVFQADRLLKDMDSNKTQISHDDGNERVWNTRYATLQVLYKELKEDYEQNCKLLGESLPYDKSPMKDSAFLDRSELNKISSNMNDANMRFDSFIPPITPSGKKFSSDLDFNKESDPVIIEKEVIKTVFIDKPVEVIVEKIVTKEVPVEKIVTKTVTVEKIVEVPVEKIVTVEKIVYIEVPVAAKVSADNIPVPETQKFCEKEPTKYEWKAWPEKKPQDLHFTGLMQDGKPDGFGTLSYPSGNKFYEGEFKDGVPCGNKLNMFVDNKDTQYLAQIAGEDSTKSYTLDNITGPAKLFHKNGKIAYEGQLVNGLRSGNGTEYYKDGKLRYNGNFSEGGYHGKEVTIYNGHLDKNVLMKGEFDKGIVNGKVDRIWFRDNMTYNGNRFIIDAHFKDGKLDTEATNTEIIHLNPTGGYYYKGHYRNGEKHGNGALYCDDTHKTIFKGEWKNNLPFKNADSESALVTLYHGKGRRMFEGTIKKSKHGGLSGYCTLYHYHDGNKIFYEGKFRAPTLCAVLFCTWDMELVNYQPFIPAF